MSATSVYKFTSCSPEDLETIKATLPAVAQAGTNFTKHFYARMFNSHPELKNLFNQTNQAKPNGQPKKLLQTVAVAAQAAIETGELPGEAVEGICHKHVALNVPAEAYGIVGENILGTIKELLTKDEKVLSAWANLYSDVASVFTSREAELKDEITGTPNSWVGKRSFELVNREMVSENIARLKFKPQDGKGTPVFKPGMYLTIWVDIPDTNGPHGEYTHQPRHYTLALPRQEKDKGKFLSISVKKQGLVSSILHEAKLGSTFDLSPPCGCFHLEGVEKLWTSDIQAPVVFLSAGVGITPVLAMLESISRPTSTWLHAEPNGNVHAYRERLREIASVKENQLVRRVWYEDPTSTDGEPGDSSANASSFNMAKYHYKGRMNLNDLLPDNVLHLDNKNAQYYMCGPPGFMEEQSTKLKELGVDAGRIHTEGF